MVAVLGQLGLARLVATIPGLTAVGAAVILAETGDPARYDSSRAWVKHAGLAPQANESGRYRGRTVTPAAGRPVLRTAAGERSGARCAATRSTPPGWPSDHPRHRPAHHRPGPRRARRRAAAPVVRRGHPPHPWEAAIASSAALPAAAQVVVPAA